MLVVEKLPKRRPTAKVMTQAKPKRRETACRVDFALLYFVVMLLFMLVFYAFAIHFVLLLLLFKFILF